jgi:hypothetical protein
VMGLVFDLRAVLQILVNHDRNVVSKSRSFHEEEISHDRGKLRGQRALEPFIAMQTGHGRSKPKQNGLPKPTPGMAEIERVLLLQLSKQGS